MASAKAPAPDIAVSVPTRVRTHPDAPGEPVSVLKPSANVLCPELWSIGIQAGFTPQNMVIVDGLLFRESRCDMSAWNKDDPNGGSRCAAQINGSWTGWLKRKPDTPIEKVDDLFKPAVCLWATRQIYLYGVQKHGWGFYPWGLKP